MTIFVVRPTRPKCRCERSRSASRLRQTALPCNQSCSGAAKRTFPEKTPNAARILVEHSSRKRPVTSAKSSSSSSETAPVAIVHVYAPRDVTAVGLEREVAYVDVCRPRPRPRRRRSGPRRGGSSRDRGATARSPEILGESGSSRAEANRPDPPACGRSRDRASHRGAGRSSDPRGSPRRASRRTVRRGSAGRGRSSRRRRSRPRRSAHRRPGPARAAAPPRPAAAAPMASRCRTRRESGPKRLRGRRAGSSRRRGRRRAPERRSARR